MRILILTILLFVAITSCAQIAEQDNVKGGQDTVTQDDLDDLEQNIESLEVEDLGGLEGTAPE